MADILRLVGNRIREIRKAKGLTQEEVGELADFHYSYIGRVERGEKNISLLTLSRISDALSVDVDQFFQPLPEIKELEEKKQVINEVLDLLTTQDASNIKRAKVILNELFKNQ